MIFRRQLLQREPATDFPGVLRSIRELSGFGTADIAFILNTARSTLNSWERGCCPNYEDGRAILKLLDNCRNSVTPRQEMAT